ncbi:hypothetical protein [Guptibacillus algicola]|uniref:hypothetical protein n=1 Tax=Guptibacillus algicola TaxID=225844 RepID=UPI001CD4DE71|nr:hypothetical protein [Alkalihalobacillus algicola]MCA0987406.1 hypothetical protein [Alkalihalobacillus algicola]
MNIKKRIALVAAFVFAFIPAPDRSDEFNRYYGFPAEVFGFHESGQLSFQVWGLLFNFFVCYMVLILVMKLSRLIANKAVK